MIKKYLGVALLERWPDTEVARRAINAHVILNFQ
jgi:hypothetical protein